MGFIMIIHPLKHQIISYLGRKFTSSAALIESSPFKMGRAFKMFEQIPEPDSLVSWNSMISGCNKSFLFKDSWRVFWEMHRRGVEMDEFTYGNVLAACGALEDVRRGEAVYGLVMKNGFAEDGYLRAGMIELFSRSRRFECALRVLYDDVRCENVVCWNTVIAGAVKNDYSWVALEVFDRMCSHVSLIPNAFTFSSVLTACAAIKELDLGKGIHGQVIKRGVEADVFVGTATVDCYAKCGDMSDAIKQFKIMPVRNVVSWTALINGFAQKGDAASAIQVLQEMRNAEEEMTNYTVSSVLAACAGSSIFNEAMQIHCLIFKIGLNSDPVVNASLVSMYSKMGAIDLSEIAFLEYHDLKQVGVFSNMISAFAQNEMYEKSVIFFKEMLNEGISVDNYSLSSVLSIIDDLNLGRQLHGFSIKSGLLSDVSVGSSILTMYSKCQNVEESLKTFEQLERKDYVTWTSMITGLAEHGCADVAINLFRRMQVHEYKMDEITLTSLLAASSALNSSNCGKEIHGFSFRCGVWDQTGFGGGLVNMYAKCGDLHSARNAFNMSSLKDQVSWSSLISGYAHTGKIEEALKLFHDMRLSDMSVNSFTISAILGAVAILSKPCIGSQLHVVIIKMRLESEPYIGSSLFIMYSKCGNIDGCSKVFQQIPYPDLVTWTAVIHSYAQHGKGSEALQAYERMKKTGIKPDANTFVGILSACSHSGLVEEGYFHLKSMISDYGIEPDRKHYACMVDLLGRAGRLEEAENFILNMPIEPDLLVWETLLASCQVHGNCALGKIATEKIMELQPSPAFSVYISLSNIFADAGKWEDVLKIRGSMKERRLEKKESGWSSV